MLPVNPAVSTDELVNRIKAYGEVRTFSAQTGVLVRNYFTGVGTKADEYPEANGQIRLQRPENIRVLVKAPVINSQVADMVSDGEKFRLALFLPTDKKKFIFGSSLKEFERMGAEEIKEAKHPELAEAGGLVNMRPQHITDAFLIKTAATGERAEFFREEVRQREEDRRPGKKRRNVDKSYYVLYVVERNENGYSALRRKFWFDRNTPGNPLVRQQTFENGAGKLASDIWYFKWFKVADSNWEWPSQVIIDRRNDGYSIELNLDKSSVEINGELPETVFVLENTQGLQEIDLDAPRKETMIPIRKP